MNDLPFTFSVDGFGVHGTSAAAASLADLAMEAAFSAVAAAFAAATSAAFFSAASA
jgi:hypothetical protein